MGRPKGISLTQSLDNKIAGLVEQLIEDKKEERKTQPELDQSSVVKEITVGETVRFVISHDSSVARTKRDLIEKSVRRVLQALKSQEETEVSVAGVDQVTDGIVETSINKSEDEVKANGKKRSKDSSTKSNKRLKEKDRTPPDASLSQLGGIDDIVAQLMELIGAPITHPEIYTATGINPPRGVLLHGPPGCGKTTLAHALAGDLQVPFISISAPSIVSGMSGESEKKVRELFQEAKNLAPCIMFIDEIDAITPKRDGAQREMEKRIVAQLLTCIDDLSMEKNNGKPVIIIGATNRPDSLDPALRRAERFDREICLNVPNEIQRQHILQSMTAKLKIDGELDFKELAKRTPGYVGADLKALATAAGVAAIKRIFSSLSDTGMDIDGFADLSTIEKFLKLHPDPLTAQQLEPLSITYQDFLNALPTIQPTAKREGFATIPDVSWSSVGALSKIRIELHMAVVQPIKHPELYERVGISAPGGVLLWGPPGCGKTLLAKAVANESRANFISIKGPELLNKYVGESEKAVRQVFNRARASVPCIIFFDELDALVPKRDTTLSESSSRVVNTLLTELDGLNDRKGIFVVGATNRPDIIDPAMLRPGRLDKTLYVELPTQEERFEILKTIVKANHTPVDSSVDLDQVSKDSRLTFFSGADLASLVREAGVFALKKRFYVNIENLDERVSNNNDNEIFVTGADFQLALATVKASVSADELVKYHAISEKMNGVITELQ